MDGINVDFEQLSQEGIPHFLQFLRELTLKAHKKNLVVSVEIRFHRIIIDIISAEPRERLWIT